MTARIPTRSKRQAMDWSLVLISQGIESTIEHSEEFGWGLIVSDEELERAKIAIENYNAENVRWPWRRRIQREIVFDWGALAWVFLIGLFFYLQSLGTNLREAGLMDAQAVSRGEWWRLSTAIFLHANIGHFAANAGIGFFLLGLTMGRFGTGIGLFAAYLAGVLGNVATWLAFENHLSLGASGLVMGCVGLLAAQAFSWRKHPQALRYFLTGIAGGVMLFALLGLSPGSDVLAHAGGFVGGFLIGIALLLAPKLAQNTTANVVAGILFTTATVLTWWLALAKS
ncbi:MAG TPA: rhomboid family intramembrane serine protease [Verrucomicrobiae bacterium]|nr:rhomboid family intramembrane serine protease [Verrucomicrobiae bacterium]